MCAWCSAQVIFNQGLNLQILSEEQKSTRRNHNPNKKQQNKEEEIRSLYI